MSETGPDARAEGRPDGAPDGRPTAVQIAAAVVGIVVLGFVVLLATRDVQRNGPNTDIVGQSVPPVAGVSYDGTRFDIDDILRANREVARADQTWVVVNFFASWCVPCRVEHPELIRFDTEGTSCPTRLVGVTFQDQAENVASFFDELGGDWPVLVGDTASMVIDFSVLTAPETVVVAPSGLVTAKIIGETSYDQLTEAVQC